MEGERTAERKYARSLMEGALNFRDLGGLQTADGRHVRRRRLFRSDSLQELTEADMVRIRRDYDVRFVVDLRRARESVEEGRGPFVSSSSIYLNIPLVDVDAPSGEPGDLTVNQYLDHLERDPNLAPAIEFTVQSLRRGATVVHCAAGKDRTGVVIALLLGMIGVLPGELRRDYLATSHNMDRIVERFGRWPRYRQNMAQLPEEIYRCEPRTIDVFLRELDARYGGALGWALQRDIDLDTINAAADTLLEPTR